MTVNKYDGTEFNEVTLVGQSDGSSFSESSVKVLQDGSWQEI